MREASTSLEKSKIYPRGGVNMQSQKFKICKYISYCNTTRWYCLRVAAKLNTDDTDKINFIFISFSQIFILHIKTRVLDTT